MMTVCLIHHEWKSKIEGNFCWKSLILESKRCTQSMQWQKFLSWVLSFDNERTNQRNYEWTLNWTHTHVLMCALKKSQILMIVTGQSTNGQLERQDKSLVHEIRYHNAIPQKTLINTKAKRLNNEAFLAATSGINLSTLAHAPPTPPPPSPSPQRQNWRNEPSLIQMICFVCSYEKPFAWSHKTLLCYFVYFKKGGSIICMVKFSNWSLSKNYLIMKQIWIDWVYCLKFPEIFFISSPMLP